jgi:hypothetical protein
MPETKEHLRQIPDCLAKPGFDVDVVCLLERGGSLRERERRRRPRKSGVGRRFVFVLETERDRERETPECTQNQWQTPGGVCVSTHTLCVQVCSPVLRLPVLILRFSPVFTRRVRRRRMCPRLGRRAMTGRWALA